MRRLDLEESVTLGREIQALLTQHFGKVMVFACTVVEPQVDYPDIQIITNLGERQAIADLFEAAHERVTNDDEGYEDRVSGGLDG